MAGTAVTISAQLADQYNNAVATQNVQVTFTRTPATGTLSTNTALTGTNGVATITFTTAAIVGTSYTVTATSWSPSYRTGFSTPITTR